MKIQQQKTKQHRWVVVQDVWMARYDVQSLHVLRNELNDADVPDDARITFHDLNGEELRVSSIRIDHTKTTPDEGEPDAKDPDPRRTGDGSPALADDEPGAGDTA